MTAGVTPYRSAVPPGRDAFGQLVRAEWAKFRTVRGWTITLAVAALVVVALAFVGSIGSHSGFCTGSTPQTATCTVGHPPVAIGPGGEPVADSYTFVHRPLAVDGSLTARVTSLAGSHLDSNGVAAPPGTSHGRQPLPAGLQPGLAPWAKAGILVEQGTGQGSAYAAVMVTGSHGVRMQYDYTHDSPGTPGPVSASSPRWLRLTRHGDLITGYDSTDGAHWTRIGATRLAGLPATAQIGMFVTSPIVFPPGSKTGYPSMATAEFDQVVAQGTEPGASWKGVGVGANTIYPTVPSGSRWHRRGARAFTVSGTGDIAPLVGGGLVGVNAGASLLLGALGGIIVLVVLATVFVTSEYRRRLIDTTFTVSPRRGRVLAAKALVVGSAAFVAGAVGAAVAVPVSRNLLVSNGNYIFPLSGLATARVIVGTGLMLGITAVLALALGAAFRRGAGAVVAGVALLAAPLVLVAALPAGASDWVMRLTPSAAFAVQGTQPRSPLVTYAYTVINGYYPLDPWAGLAVLCGYAAVALGIACWLLRRRDV